MAKDYIPWFKTNLSQLREGIEEEIKPGRERSLALTKIEEAELWLSKCQEND